MEINQQTAAFVRAHRTEDVRDLALHARRDDGIDVPWALDQIAGWQIARRKLPQWAACDGIVYPPHLSMEQCSSEATARYKARLARRLTACGGMAGNPSVGDPTAVGGPAGVGPTGSGSMGGGPAGGPQTDAASPCDGRRVRGNPTAGGPARDDLAPDADPADVPAAGDAPACDGPSAAPTANAGPAVGQAPQKRRGSMADLTGGFGVDFSYMAEGFARATYVERQPHLCAIAEHNMAVLGLDQAQVVQADAEDHLARMAPVDVIAVDPARRDEHGSRTYAVADCTPDVLALKPLLLRKAGHVIVKLSPMLDWRKTVADFGGAVSEVHIVSVGNECKELLLVLEPPERHDGLRRLACVNITPHGEDVFDVVPGGAAARGGTSGDGATHDGMVGDGAAEWSETTGTADAAGAAGSPGPADAPAVPEHSPAAAPDAASWRYLYEPNASIMKAGCFDALAGRYGVAQVAPNSHVFVSTEPVAGFPGRGFCIETVTTMGRKELRRALAGTDRANITVRNFPMGAEQLRRKLRLKDGGDVYLFATTLRDGRHAIIVTTKAA